jgi:signal transduction histidine kinase/DNA-binding NarL/FixJ family response regulator
LNTDAIRDELSRLAQSSHLARSKRLLRFLTFTSEWALERGEESLSEYVIAREVYDRRDDFNPVTDGIVRAEAHRLRAKLRDYYRGAGRHDPIIVEYPLGSYVPKFLDWAPDFLPMSGKVAKAIRSRDWNASVLGPLTQWPRSLKACLSVHLRLPFPVAVCWGTDLILLYNDAMQMLIGEDRRDWLGQRLGGISHANWQYLKTIVKRVQETGEPSRVEKTLWLRDRGGYQEEAYFDTFLSPISDSAEISGVMLAFTDVTEAVLSERRNNTCIDLSASFSNAANVEEAIREAARILEKNPYDIPFACVYLFDSVNTRAELYALAGISAGTYASPEFIPLSGEGAPLTAAVSSGRPELLSIGTQFGRLPTGAWEVPAWEIVVLPLRVPNCVDPIGALIAGVNPHHPPDPAYRGFFETVARQISGIILRARGLEDERRYVEQAKRQETIWSSFLTYAEEEFRTPLTVTLGVLDQIVKGGSPPHSGKLATARRNALRLMNLFETMVDLMAVQNGRLQPAFEPVDLGDITGELARSFASALDNGSIHFSIDSPSLAESAYVDRRLWEKLVLTLLSNAVQLTRAGEIGIAVRLMGAWIETVVWDTGAGIAEGELPRIFEPFSQDRAIRSVSGRRNGVSLALVKHFAALHSGHVRVESEPGKGSKFVVSIPRGRSHLGPLQIASEHRAGSPVSQGYVEDVLRWTSERLTDLEPTTELVNGDISDWQHRDLGRRRRRRVLIVESDSDLRQYLTHIAGEVYSTEAVADGKAALDTLRQRPADLMILDTKLRDSDGLSMVRAVRADPSLGGIPIVLISAHAQDEDRLRAFAAGANDFLVKPFTAPELLVHLESQIALAETRNRIAERNEAQSQEGAGQWALLQAVLDQMPIGVVVAAASGELVLKNQKAHQLFGPLANEVQRLEQIPETFGQHPDGTPVRRDQCPLVRAVTSGETVVDELIHYDLPNTRRFLAMVNARPISNSSGRRIGAVITYHPQD